MPKESCHHLKRWFKKPAHESVYPLNCSMGLSKGSKSVLIILAALPEGQRPCNRGASFRSREAKLAEQGPPLWEEYAREGEGARG